MTGGAVGRAHPGGTRRSAILAGVRLLMLILLPVACARSTPVAGASPESEPPREPRRITVIVQNNPRSPSVLTVFVQTRNGGRQMLGTVLPDATEAFQYTPDAPSGDCVLIGRSPYGTEVVSNPFPISRTAVVSWSLFSNVATTTVEGELDP